MDDETVVVAAMTQAGAIMASLGVSGKFER
jgi:hypothetical protein